MKKSRLNQRRALLVALASAQGLLAANAVASPSSDTINTPTTGAYIIPPDFETLQITDQGSISGAQSSPALIIAPHRSVDLIENNGAILGSSNSGTGTTYGAILSSGTIGSLVNNGLISQDISGGQVADIITLDANSQLGSLTNSGGIENESANGSAISNAGSIVTLSNTETGRISNYIGIKNSGQINYFKNLGVISNKAALNPSMFHQAVENRPGASIDNFVNIGTIAGMDSASQAIRNLGTIQSFYNSGVISSAYTAITNDGVIGSFVNDGLISAPTAIEFGNNGQGTSTTTVTNTGTIAGNVYNYTSAYNMITFVSEPNSTSTVTGFNGDIGRIENYYGGVTFTGGNTLLNSNISAYGGAVLNDASALQVNNPLTINGDYHQNAGAALVIGIGSAASANGNSANDSGYGRLMVSGSATIDEGSHVALVRTSQGYSYAPGQRYVVISAAGNGTQYNAQTLHYSALDYQGGVTGYTAGDGQNTALVLELGDIPTTPGTPSEPTNPTNPATPTTPTTPVTPGNGGTPGVPATPGNPVNPGNSGNPVTTPSRASATLPGAVAALNGLASYSGISDPQLLELYNASLAIAGKSEANRVGERLSASQNINASTATNVAVSKAMTVVGTHMDSVRKQETIGKSGISTGDAYDNWIFWGQPFGGYARQDSSGGVSGYSAKFGGMLLGADRAVGDSWRLGAAVDYSNTSVHGKDNLSGNTSTADNYGVIGYAGYTGKPWYMNLSAALNRQNYQSSRQADFTGFSGLAQGKFNGSSVTLQSEFGYPFTLPAGVVVTPMATLAYSYQHVDGYKESGGNGMALDVDSTHAQSVTSDIGARVEKTIATGVGKLTPFAQVSWIHQYDDRQMDSTATYAADAIGETRFTTKGAAPVRDMAGVAVGSTLYDDNNLSLDARYDLQAGDRYQAHTFSLRLQKTF